MNRDIKNPMLGKFHSRATKEKISLANKGRIPWNKGLTKETNDIVKRITVKISGERNTNWKGSRVGDKGLHRWIRKYKPKSDYCEECKKVKPYDIANISGEYIRDINDFRWLCRSCHVKSDGRLFNLKNHQRGKE